MGELAKIEKDDNANIIYGRLQESVHLSGYSLERAMGEFKWLLEKDRWKLVGTGHEDINEFLKTLNFSEFKIAIEQRKNIAKKLAELQASQRATAKMMGVSQMTVQRDTETNVSLRKNIPIDNEAVINDTETNVSSPEKSWFEKSGKEVTEREQKNVHVSNNSGENEWYTPIKFIESARSVMGSIDLDPATSELANEIIKAEQIFTEFDNGLDKIWSGNIWMNPPYAQPLINEFSDKLVSELPNIKQACVLVNNATETTWLQNMMKKSIAVCFLKGRVKFIDMNGEATGAPLQGQVILYFGGNIDKFFNEFNKYGICLKRIEDL